MLTINEVEKDWAAAIGTADINERKISRSAGMHIIPTLPQIRQMPHIHLTMEPKI